MAKLTRRQTLHGLAAVAAGGLAAPMVARAAGPRVAVIGGGFGGATTAKYLRKLDPQIEVDLIEPAEVFYTCPFSNKVLGGLRTMDQIGHRYDNLAVNHGVNVVRAAAEAVDADAKRVRLADGAALAYDRLVVSPGIDLQYDAMEGWGRAVEERIPHSWKAGPQTRLLRAQLEAMPDGGTVLICPPANPFRCPPGPYERASLIAYYLQQNKPRSKVVILDRKENFSKQALFMQGWQQVYGNMIEWRAKSAGGNVLRVDADAMGVETDFGLERGDVINFIPQQTAGRIALETGLADDDGWCPIDQATFESTKIPGIHVIGDAAKAGAMPKSGFSANSQGKVLAAALIALFREETPVAPSFANTCYSLIASDYGISVAAVYRLEDGGIKGVEGAGGVSPMDADAEFRAREAVYADGWYASAVMDTWGA